MSNQPPPPGSGPPPGEGPFSGAPGSGPPPPGGPFGDAGPFGGSPGGGGPYGQGPGGGGPYGQGPGGAPGGPGHGPDPLAGMPPLAPSGIRTLARIIDMIIVGIVAWLVSVALGASTWSLGRNSVDYGTSLAESAVAAVLYMAYDTWLIGRDGQTIGKRLFRLRVANLSDGNTPSYQVSLTRAAVLWVPFAFLCACVWTVICGGWSYFDRPYKQGLHDKVARTVVVSTEEPPRTT